VDRDDDFGTKTNIKSPIVGREANLNAAIALGLADPEEVDANTVLSAIKIHDELVKSGRESEIATICGAPQVGFASDQILAKQLDEILAKVVPEEAVFVSDGADDEVVLPIITSRVKVASVKRVIMKQAQNIESSYYFLAKALKDERIQRKFIVPLGLFLLIISISAILGYSAIGLAIVCLVIGIYLLIGAFNLEPALARAAKDFKEGLITGRLSLFTWVVGGLIILVGFAFAYTENINKPLSFQMVFSAFTTVIWWFICGLILGVFGRMFDKYIREGEILWSYWVVPFSLITFGLVIFAVKDVVDNISEGPSALIKPPLFWYLVGKLSLAIVIGSIGVTTHKYIKKHITKEEKGIAWRY
jgi:putative membrane protein